MHKSSQVCPEGRGYSSVVGAAGIPIYPEGGRLCLSACPGDGEVKKALPPPEDNFWNSPYQFAIVSVTLSILYHFRDI